MGIFDGLKKIFKKIAPIIGIVASIAIPALAPAVASVLQVSGAVAGAITGAVVSGATTALAGGDFKQVAISALTGGAGGYLASGGLQQLTSYASQALGFAPPAAAGTAPITSAAQLAPPLEAGVPITTAGATAPSAVSTGLAAPGQAATTFSNLTSQLANKAPQAIAQLSQIVFGTSTENLDAAQQAYINKLAEEAKQNQALFAQKLAAFQQALQGGISPEAALNQTFNKEQRAALEAEREARAAGRSAAIPGIRRRSSIAASREGARASVAAGDYNARRQVALAQGLPTIGPPIAGAEKQAVSAAATKLAIDARQQEQLSNVYGQLFGPPKNTQQQQQQKAGVSVPSWTTSVIPSPGYTYPQPSSSTPSNQPTGDLFLGDGMFT